MYLNIKLSLYVINPLNAELNPIYHLLPLLGAHQILHVSRVRVEHGDMKTKGWDRHGCECSTPWTPFTLMNVTLTELYSQCGRGSHICRLHNHPGIFRGFPQLLPRTAWVLP